MNADDFAAKLKAYRKENFLTQEQMAKLLGLSANHIGTLEQGKKRPRASTMAAFEELMRRTGPPEQRDANPTDPMSEEEVALYSQLWRELKCLEPQQEKELLEMFSRILDWI